MIVSTADGLIECTSKQTCCNMSHSRHHKESLVMFHYTLCDQDSNRCNQQYTVPVREVPMCLLAMAAYAAEYVLFCNVTNESIVFIKIRNDPNLWDKLFSLAEQLYREDKPHCPTCTNMEIKDLFPKLQQFITQNTTFVCELPCIKGETVIGISCHKDFPFSDSPELNIVPTCSSDFMKPALIVAEDCVIMLKRIHTILHVEATEALMFIIANSDRLGSDGMSTSLPLAYALKGSSLNNSQLRYLINKCRNILKERKIRILVECYDGQWHKTVVYMQDGEPLT